MPTGFPPAELLSPTFPNFRQLRARPLWIYPNVLVADFLSEVSWLYLNSPTATRILENNKSGWKETKMFQQHGLKESFSLASTTMEDTASESSGSKFVAAADFGMLTTSRSSRVDRLNPIPRLLLHDAQKYKVDAVVKALKQLVKMIASANYESKKNQREAIEVGAPAVVLLTMRNWRHNESITSAGLECLLWLTVRSNPGASATIKCGGVDAVADALAAFPDSRWILNFGGTVILNILAARLDSQVRQAALDTFLHHDVDGIRLLQQAMKRFRDDDVVQSTCCAVLYVVLKLKLGYKTEMVKRGVVVDVATAMKNHHDNDTIQTHGRNYIRTMYGIPLTSKT